MAANRLPASWMNALDPAAGARRSRLTAARAGAPRCPYISRRSLPASGPTVPVPSSVRRGELPRLRAPFARNVIPGAHAGDRARAANSLRAALGFARLLRPSHDRSLRAPPPARLVSRIGGWIPNATAPNPLGTRRARSGLQGVVTVWAY